MEDLLPCSSSPLLAILTFATQVQRHDSTLICDPYRRRTGVIVRCDLLLLSFTPVFKGDGNSPPLISAHNTSMSNFCLT